MVLPALTATDSKQRRTTMSRRLLVSLAILAAVGVGAGAGEETLTFDAPQCAGVSGFRAHWDKPVPVAENGERQQ
jgi:hypothetical protein